MPLSPAERRLQSQYGAHVSWAKTPNRSARTKPARDALECKFERQVDPEGTMPPEARAQAVASARKAYYVDLARKSAEARRARKAAS